MPFGRLSSYWTLVLFTIRQEKARTGTATQILLVRLSTKRPIVTEVRWGRIANAWRDARHRSGAKSNRDKERFVMSPNANSLAGIQIGAEPGSKIVYSEANDLLRIARSKWSTWMDPRMITGITGARTTTKEDLKKVVYEQVKEQGPMTPEKKKKVDQGINTIFEKVELTTAKAKDPEASSEEADDDSAPDSASDTA
jgi:hypothetical protein